MTIYREFKMMIQSNAWSCLPTAFAMVMQVEPRVVLGLCRHDGSEIVFPDLEEPWNHRGFHLQEMIDAAMRLMETPVLIEAEPDFDEGYKVPFPASRFENYLEQYAGVILGIHEAKTPHAVAWDGETVWDPRGQKYDKKQFESLAFVAFP